MREELLDRITEAVRKMLGEDYTVQHAKVVKNNDTVHVCCQIRKNEECIAKSTCIDEMLRGVEIGKYPVVTVAEEIVRVYREDADVMVQLRQSASHTKGEILERVVYCVINREKNTEYLKDKVYREFLDLAVTYRIVVDQQENGIATYAITHSQCEALGISAEELEAAAKRNLEKGGFRVQLLGETLAVMTGNDEWHKCCVELWVCTNQIRINGACVMLSDRCLHELAEKIGDDLIILPSSVHEVLAMPMNKASNVVIQNMQNMVSKANASVVAAVDVLGNSVYMYNRKTGAISVLQEGR